MALFALVGFGAWYVSGSDRSPKGADDTPTAAKPSPVGVPEPTPSLAAPMAAQTEGDPCSGLELLDVEAGPDGTTRGAWLRSGHGGPQLVRVGGQFSRFTLTRIAALAPGSQSATLWFGDHRQPCQLKVVQGIDLARVLPSSPAQKGPALAQPTSSAASLAITREPHPVELQDRVRNPALAKGRFGSRAAGSGTASSRLTPASVDGGAP